MPAPEPPKKKYPSFTMRLSEEELAMLKHKAGLANLSEAALVRKLIAKQEVRAAEDMKLLREIKSALSPIGNNLNQIARHANRFRADAKIQEMTAALVAVQADLGRLLLKLEAK